MIRVEFDPMVVAVALGLLNHIALESDEEENHEEEAIWSLGDHSKG